MTLAEIIVALMPILLEKGQEIYAKSVKENWTDEQLQAELTKVRLAISKGISDQAAAIADAKAKDTSLDSRIDNLK